MDRFSKYVLLSLSFTFLPVSVVSQEQTAPSVSRDPQAVAILAQALTVAGASAQGAQDFTATGAITYYWAGEEVKGSAMIRGKGTEQFSLEVTLPEKTRSVTVKGGKGATKEIDGSTTVIPYYNARNQAAATLPLLRVAASLSNPSTSVSYEGVVDVDGRSAHHIRLLAPNPEDDPENRFKDLRTLDVFVDASSFLVVKTRDTIHAERDMNDHYARELFFSDYRAVNGVLVPFAMSEKFGGQRTWSLQLDSVSF